MVLLYMVTWIPSIYPLSVSIYTSTMDPMGYRISYSIICLSMVCLNEHPDILRNIDEYWTCDMPETKMIEDVCHSFGTWAMTFDSLTQRISVSTEIRRLPPKGVTFPMPSDSSGLTWFDFRPSDSTWDINLISDLACLAFLARPSPLSYLVPPPNDIQPPPKKHRSSHRNVYYWILIVRKWVMITQTMPGTSQNAACWTNDPAVTTIDIHFCCFWGLAAFSCWVEDATRLQRPLSGWWNWWHSAHYMSFGASRLRDRVCLRKRCPVAWLAHVALRNN